ncbi:MAG TPA: undecaprenyldiphospho-muramoylpentapeptide beta-N-acetylglucosaminyltransferase [Verrucomicrobiae bacterium]|jgi:UDP-N-acetylglucosamine--N-acetylmuramyl-(pentapeptide) pyrophosphoryl-undecaprenol N-acetylglucosamine transferase|nr:undecaprenyldiphospho-muramoylpentapeptide beta-N-acetylglucosaminyltransferase [Verrucomicrobiae bacterium]
MQSQNSAPRVAIACGGTGGHLFPGVAVAEELKRRGCAVTLLISPKEVDQKAVQGATGVQIATLPAIGLTRGKYLAFARGFAQSYRTAKKLFAAEKPEAVLAMGGFTSAPPVLAGKSLGVPTFLHESNTIPGRANRWLSWVVSEAFVGFSDAATRLHTRNVKVTGTPVRPQFQPMDLAACRAALGLDPQKPVLLVTGGSQGASGLNDLVIATLPFLAKQLAGWQLFHLTGPTDVEKVQRACAAHNIHAVVKPFFGEMHLALGAASVTISRAGASSLAEFAAMRVPSVLVPFPAATDNHQFYNARAFEKTGAAVLLGQRGASAEMLALKISELAQQTASRERMCVALGAWHSPQAAERIAESIMQAITARRTAAGGIIVPAATHLKNQQSAIT